MSLKEVNALCFCFGKTVLIVKRNEVLKVRNIVERIHVSSSLLKCCRIICKILFLGTSHQSENNDTCHLIFFHQSSTIYLTLTKSYIVITINNFRFFLGRQLLELYRISLGQAYQPRRVYRIIRGGPQMSVSLPEIT